MRELDLLKNGGVVGGGGAGFPLWKKLETPVQTLLINAAECEPLLQSDQYLMLKYPQELVVAASVLARIAQAQEAVICLKDHYTAQRDALQKAIESATLPLPVRLHMLPTVYPIGDEQAVVHSATRRTVAPGALPSSVGCTVTSVSTALNALRALQEKPVVSRFVTVAGEVRKPGVYEAPIGTPVRLLLEMAGGVSCRDYRLQLGGPMMGPIVDGSSEQVVTKTLGGVLVLPAEHKLVKHHELPLEQMKNRARSVCIQCRTCTDLCPRHLLGHPIYPHLTMRAYAAGDRLEPSAMLCMECGVCELYACPMGLNPRRIQQLHKAGLRAAGIKTSFTLGEANPMASSRAVPSERIIARIGVSSYVIQTPKEATKVIPEVVCIPVKQHIGAPATPCVEVGQSVHRGDTIAKIADGALGADIHASICGRVIRIENGMIVIQSCKEGEQQ